MNHHSRYSSILEPVETCIVGGGGAFGRTFLSQSRFIRRISARIAVDLSAEVAAKALAAADVPADRIRLCSKPSEALAAWNAGDWIAAGSFVTVADLPFHILVEATGQPEAAARHSLMAIDRKRHVLLVTKETDSVAGPMLARLARANGVGVTPVDGDQPSLLIDLVTWAETLGFEILAAGKSSEYDFVFDRASGRVTSNGVSADLPNLRNLWEPGARDLREIAAQRASVIGTAFPLRAVPDLCELTLVANSAGFGPDTPGLHAPVARISEVASLLSISREHGLLRGNRRLDVFHHLRAPDEASFAGGVFAVVPCRDREAWQILAEKGHAVSPDGATAMLYLPRHLLGLEAATSILDLAGLGRSAYGDDYRPRIDLVAIATRALAAGTVLTAKGHHHSIDGVAGEMRPARPIASDEALPYYLAADRKLARAVGTGDPIRLSDLELAADSVLLDLRRRQDASFT